MAFELLLNMPRITLVRIPAYASMIDAGVDYKSTIRRLAVHFHHVRQVQLLCKLHQFPWKLELQLPHWRRWLGDRIDHLRHDTARE